MLVTLPSASTRGFRTPASPFDALPFGAHCDELREDFRLQSIPFRMHKKEAPACGDMARGLQQDKPKGDVETPFGPSPR
jgi:hypothetical protein